jgi:hypothetical protein
MTRNTRKCLIKHANLRRRRITCSLPVVLRFVEIQMIRQRHLQAVILLFYVDYPILIAIECNTLKMRQGKLRLQKTVCPDSLALTDPCLVCLLLSLQGAPKRLSRPPFTAKTNTNHVTLLLLSIALHFTYT